MHQDKPSYRILLALLIAVSMLPRQATARVVPIDPDLFTIESSPGIATWTGHTLTLDLSKGGPNYGGYTQKEVLPTSVLPDNIIGISFRISSSLTNPRISFGYLTYDSGGYGQGAVDLVNYLSVSDWDLTTWTSQTTGLGTLSDVLVYLGADYSPFSLSESYHNPLEIRSKSV